MISQSMVGGVVEGRLDLNGIKKGELKVYIKGRAATIFSSPFLANLLHVFGGKVCSSSSSLLLFSPMHPMKQLLPHQPLFFPF
jgi:hypothetical protein